MTSIRLALVLLLLLAGASLIGTLLPQGEEYAYYVNRFGSQAAALIWWLNLARVYQSPWFLALLGLLLANLIACSCHRWPDALRRLNQPLALEKYQALPERGQVRWGIKDQDPQMQLETYLQQVLGRTQIQAEGHTFWYLSFRGRRGYLGPYLIHLSIVLIILGGLIGMIWGFQGHVVIPEGEAVNRIEMDGHHDSRQLDFSLRLDRFQIISYPDGTPREYRSELSFISEDRQVFQGICRVNDPLSYNGLRFYQASYQTVPAGPIRLNVCHGNLCSQIEVPWRTKVDLPGGEASLIVLRIEPNFQGLGPALLLGYKNGPGHPAIFWVAKNFPEGAQSQPGPHRFTLAELGTRYASGLMVKRDPGVWWAYAGFILLLPGFWLAFFTPRQRWAIALKPDAQDGWLIQVHGSGARNKEAFQRRLNRLLTRLEKGASP
ncbi:MAG: cytochrome c biogenesis protein ResB [Desulfobacteraceae bacterium]